MMRVSMRATLMMMVLLANAAPAVADLIVTGGQVFNTARGAFASNTGIVIRGGRFFEIGAGKVLTGLVKRIADGAVGIAVGGPNDIAAAKDALAAAKQA